MQVASILGLKANESFSEALKVDLDDSSENLLYKC